MQLVKGFFYFIFFKVMLGSLLRYEYPIVAAAILAVAIVLIEMGAAAFYAHHLGKHLAKITFGNEDRSEFFGNITIVFLASVLAGILSAFFITMGFAGRFYETRLTSYRGLAWDEVFWFSVPIIIAMTCNFATVIFGIKLAEKRMRPESDGFLK